MASVGFRWLDILEKEFDKAFVDLDLTIGELDSEEPVIVYNVRQKLCTLSSCFAQLTHKAQTIFQNSAKIEAELIHMRAELVDSKAKREILDQELHTLLLQLHSTQLSKIPQTNGAIFKPDPNLKPDVNSIKKKLEEEIKRSPSHIVRPPALLASSSNGEPQSSGVNEALGVDVANIEFNPNLVELKQLRGANAQLLHENVALRNNVLALNSEVYGAKLAAKYLDKELAGRIQQLQLLGREMRGDVRDKLWRQLESEILLQRHKTVVRECRRNSILNHNSAPNGGDFGAKKPSSTIATANNLHHHASSVLTTTTSIVSNSTDRHTPEHFGDVRTVLVKRKSGQGLGISITGGREHGVPILISELESNGPAALSGELYIGDAILAVNEKDLRQACHKEAVDILKQHCEECRLQVQYIAADDSDNSLEEDGFHFRFFDNAVCDSNDTNGSGGGIQLGSAQRDMLNTPTAPRTPESASYQSGSSTSRLNDADFPFDHHLNNQQLQQQQQYQRQHRIDNNATASTDPSKSYQVSPEIQKVIDSLQTQDAYNFTANLATTTNTAHRHHHLPLVAVAAAATAAAESLTVDNARKDFLIDTGDFLHVTANNDINRNQAARLADDCTTGDLIVLDNQRHIDDYKKQQQQSAAVDNLNCSSNSLNSENLSSPMQTSTDMFMDSEVLSTDVASNDSHSPKTKDVCGAAATASSHAFDAIYGSNETFSNTKSDQSLLNSSCDSSPVHKVARDYKKTKKFKSKKYFGVKTLQSIFNKQRDGYSDISSNASDCPNDDDDDEDEEEEPQVLHKIEEKPLTPPIVAPQPDEKPVETTTYKYRTILTETSPQFEENIHSFLSEIFMKNFQTPDTPEATATTSKMGTKRYLRVGKALRLCSNDDNANALSEYEQRREKLLARYVYNSNSLSADGEGNPDFGTPV